MDTTTSSPSTSSLMIPSMSPSRRTRRRRAAAKRVNVVAGQKWCPKCQSRLSLDAFGVAKDREDGRTGWCRECRAARTRDRRASRLDAERRAGRERYAENPEIWHAKVAVYRAKASGRLQPPAPGTPCACGSVSPLEAHHHLGHDRENWLNVVWRCRSCRVLADASRDDRGGADGVAAVV